MGQLEREERVLEERQPTLTPTIRAAFDAYSGQEQ